MDVNISLLAFGFVIAPFLLAACDGTTPVVPDNNPTPTIIDQQTEGDDSDNTDVEESDVKNNELIDPAILTEELVSTQPSFFKNSDVEYTGIVKIDAAAIMDPYKDEMMEIYNEGSYSDTDWDNVVDLFQWYEVGNITGGKYEGQKMLVSNMMCDGMCMYPSIYRFAYDADTMSLVALSAISGEVDPGNYAEPLLDDEDETTLISGVVLPDEITLPDGIHVISKTMDDAGFELPGLLQNVLFTDLNVGKVYGSLEGLGCFYVLKPDGTIAKYEFDPGFFDDETLEIEWNDGSSDTNVMNNYGYAHYGCGIQGNCYTVEKADMSALEEVGVTTDGMKMYVAKNPIE